MSLVGLEKVSIDTNYGLSIDTSFSVILRLRKKKKKENDKVKVTWSSKREGGAAVTNLFIWFYYKRKVNLFHFPTYVTKRGEQEEKRNKEKKRNRKKKFKELFREARRVTRLRD